MSGNGLNAMENLVRASPGLRELSVSEDQCTSKMSQGGRWEEAKESYRKRSPVGKRNSNPRMQLMNYFVTLFS